MVGLSEHPTRRVSDFEERVIAPLVRLDEPFVVGLKGYPKFRRTGSDGPKPCLKVRPCRVKAVGAGGRRRRADARGQGQLEQCKGNGTGEAQDGGPALIGLGTFRTAVYTHAMEVHDADKDVRSPAGPAIEPAVPDPVDHLTAVYRDYPGLRALIIRRVHDPQLAADILQDAAVTTLEKLRAGEIAQPSCIGGYLYRVALNHLRNYRRKDRAADSSSMGLESVPDHDDEPNTDGIDRSRWADIARRMLSELPTPRDREVLIRFYLNDESKDDICAALQLSDDHFKRVIFRARNRFREILENRGYTKRDLLTAAAIGLSAGTLRTAMATRHRGQ